MNMVKMDIPDDDSSPMVAGDSYCQAPHVYLTAAQVKALGITEPPRAGTKLMLQAQVSVESTTESIDGDLDDPDIKLCLCLEYVELSQAQDARDPADGLYGNG